MIAICPKCGSRRFRVLRTRSWRDKLAEFLGSFRLKCSECSTAYRKTWSPKDYLYAKCPRCLRTDLTFWSEQYYRPPFGITMQIALGARRLRCEACRHNFASFRMLKARYKRPGERNIAEPPAQSEAVRDKA